MMEDATIIIKPKETEKGITGKINHEKAVKMLALINEQEGTHYAIPEGKGELGAGGFATVFDVEDREQYDFGLVAKFYPVSEHYEKYLDREMEFLINHNLGGELLPRTLHIYEICHGDNGQNRTRIVIMEKYEEVADYFEMPLSEDSLLQIASDILESLHYLHGNNGNQKYYFHRDIKPDNIMVNNHLNSPRCILIDFNTVRESDDTHVNNPTMIGSRPFMPPELMDGERHTFRRNMELYALGSVLYYYITGKTPTGMIQNGRTREDIVNELCHASSEKKISDEFQAIILRAVENDPEFRYQAAEEMQEDIEAMVKSRDSRDIGQYSLFTLYFDGKEFLPSQNQQKQFVHALKNIINVSDPGSFIHYFLGMSKVDEEEIAYTLSTMRKERYDDKWPEWTPAAIQYYSCIPEENDMVMPTPSDLSREDYDILRKTIDSFTNDINNDLWVFINVVTLLMDRIETESCEDTLEDTTMNHDIKKEKWDKDTFLSILNKIVYVDIDDDIKKEIKLSYSNLSTSTKNKIMQALFMYVNADSKKDVFCSMVGEQVFEFDEVYRVRYDDENKILEIGEFDLKQEEIRYDHRPKDISGHLDFYLDELFFEADYYDSYDKYEEYGSHLSSKDQEILAEIRKRIQFYDEESFFLCAALKILLAEDPKILRNTVK